MNRALVLLLLSMFRCFEMTYCFSMTSTIRNATRKQHKCNYHALLRYGAMMSHPQEADHDDRRSRSVSSNSTSTIMKQSNLSSLFCSRVARLDPTRNRFHAPLVYHEHYSFDDWPDSHTFPMNKFGHTQQALLSTSKRTHPSSNLPRPLVRHKDDFFRPLDFMDIPIRQWMAACNTNPTTTADATTDDGDSMDFMTRFLQGQLAHDEARDCGFREQTHRPELIERTVLEVAGTVLTCQLACHYGIASNVAGGTHHAHPQGGAGYTLLNDLAVASQFLTTPELHQGSIPFDIQTVLVVDCDVHQGDGTAKYSTLWEKNKKKDDDPPSMVTLSLHCASNYPHDKATSTYDVGLRDGCDDEEYLTMLQEAVTRACHETKPDFVLYDAGVDVYQGDRLGRLNLSEEGIRRRDRWVLEYCVNVLKVPVAAVIGGGYDKDDDALARRHAVVHEECAYVWRKYQMHSRNKR